MLGSSFDSGKFGEYDPAMEKEEGYDRFAFASGWLAECGAGKNLGENVKTELPVQDLQAWKLLTDFSGLYLICRIPGKI